MKPIYVICFYWQGERWVEEGREDNSLITDNSFKKHLRRVGANPKWLVEKYVNNLMRGVHNNSAGLNLKYVCFTNEKLNIDPSIEMRPFPMVTTKGVIPRMYMFSRDAGLFGHQVLCLDLDVVITGSLKDILSYEGLFCVRRGFAGPDKGKLDGDIMSFKACESTERIFWEPFIKDIKATEKLTTGRERFWVRHVAQDIADTFDEVAPNQIYSYKSHVKRKGLPGNARIVSCHGFPRPHQIKQEWIRKHWN